MIRQLIRTQNLNGESKREGVYVIEVRHNKKRSLKKLVTMILSTINCTHFSLRVELVGNYFRPFLLAGFDE